VPNVVDNSHGDAVTSFAAARAAGVLGVIHKATTGQSGADPAYAQRRKDATEAGLLWGAYHWGTAAPAAAQVNNFLNVAKPDESTLIALDFEADPGNQMTLDLARSFLQGVESALGRKAVLYSGSTIKEALGPTKDAFFGAHRLWLAQYGAHPVVQASWPAFWLWQYSDGTSGAPATIPGIQGDSQGRVDCDRFPGTETELRAQWAS
jgi:GH25 family lysozyme M1 (1,4-beta-N-acetylmuramidase)